MSHCLGGLISEKIPFLEVRSAPVSGEVESCRSHSLHQGAISCGTALPPVAASAGALTLAGSPSIRAFVAKSILSRFTRFWMYHFQSQHTRFCREISFVALLGVSFSAIHGDEWLFHDYDASAGLPMLAQGCQR